MVERAVPAITESISTTITRNSRATFENRLRAMMTSSVQSLRSTQLRNRCPGSRLSSGKTLGFLSHPRGWFSFLTGCPYCYTQYHLCQAFSNIVITDADKPVSPGCPTHRQVMIGLIPKSVDKYEKSLGSTREKIGLQASRTAAQGFPECAMGTDARGWDRCYEVETTW